MSVDNVNWFNFVERHVLLIRLMRFRWTSNTNFYHEILRGFDSSLNHLRIDIQIPVKIILSVQSIVHYTRWSEGKKDRRRNILLLLLFLRPKRAKTNIFVEKNFWIINLTSVIWYAKTTITTTRTMIERKIVYLNINQYWLLKH